MFKCLKGAAVKHTEARRGEGNKAIVEEQIG